MPKWTGDGVLANGVMVVRRVVCQELNAAREIAAPRVTSRHSQDKAPAVISLARKVNFGSAELSFRAENNLPDTCNPRERHVSMS